MVNALPIQRATPVQTAAFDSARQSPQIPRIQIKLLHKLLAVFLALSILPLLYAGHTLIGIGDNYVQKESRGVKMGIAQKVASNVDSYMENVKDILVVVHKSNDFLRMKPQPQREILTNVMNAYPMFMSMVVLDIRGKEISKINLVDDASPGINVREKMKALASIRSLQHYYIGPLSRSRDGYPQMTIGVPIERVPGRPVGVLLGVVNLIGISSLIRDLAIGKNGYVYIVDMNQQQLVAHPKMDTLLDPNTPSEVTSAGLSPAESVSGAIEFDVEKNKFLDTYATVPLPRDWRVNWRVFVQQPTAEAYEASTQMRARIKASLVFVILAVLCISFVLSNWLVQRVQTLQSAMELVGEGNFDVPRVPASNDEFGALTEKFLWMAGSLKDKTLRLVSAQKELQRWNSELEARVQERTRALQEAQEQLISQEKLAALGQMASVVGHELRNPLAVMNNSVYFLKTKLNGAAGDAGLDPKLTKHLQILESEIIKSNTIIRDVLDFARNRALNAAPKKVDELVEKAIERIQIPPNVVLRKDLTLNATEAMVDEDEIRQILVNLMENACQAMTSGGTLSVGTKTYEDNVEIDIGDTGCGIPQEHLSKIFAPFFTTKSRGTGLGLAVVKKIIERHRGVIEVQSVVGEGTVFHIRLPINQPLPTTPIQQGGAAPV